MLFDTDMFIWVQRGNSKATALIEKTVEHYISVASYMELIQGAKNKQQHTLTKDFIIQFEFIILPLSANIGHRASVYMEEYALSHGISSMDAIIAATATENNLTLSSSNAKHFWPIKELKLKVFKS